MLRAKNLLRTCYVFFGIIPLFCFFLDLILSVVIGEPNVGRISFDESFFNQVIFFTNWVNLFISVWAWCNLAALNGHKLPVWIVSKNAETMVVGLSVVMFLIYVPSLMNSTVPGFNIWYKILKSVLEHIILPITMVVFYYSHEHEFVASQKFLRRYGFYPLIYQLIYGAFIYLRVGLLLNYGQGDPYSYTHMFPYLQSNFFITPWPIFVLYVVLFFWGNYLLQWFLNWTSNLRQIKYEDKLRRILYFHLQVGHVLAAHPKFQLNWALNPKSR